MYQTASAIVAATPGKVPPTRSLGSWLPALDERQRRRTVLRWADFTWLTIEREPLDSMEAIGWIATHVADPAPTMGVHPCVARPPARVAASIPSDREESDQSPCVWLGHPAGAMRSDGKAPPTIVGGALPSPT